MRAYKCENCGSIFIVNETDERIASGDYCFVEDCNCPLCSAGMVLMGMPESEQEG